MSSGNFWFSRAASTFNGRISTLSRSHTWTRRSTMNDKDPRQKLQAANCPPNVAPQDYFGNRKFSDGSHSSPTVREWLAQIAADYERLEHDSKLLGEENARLMMRLQQMEDFAKIAKEHERQMEVGDAVEARLMTPSRLPPLRASDFGCGAQEECSFFSAVNWLQRSDSTEIVDRANSTIEEGYDVVTAEGHEFEAGDDYDGENPLFPTWFTPSTEQGKQQQESVSTKAEAEIDMWLQKVEAREIDSNNNFVLSPVGKFRICWDFVWFMVLAYDIWVLCFTCAFMANSCSFVLTYNLISTFLVFDICLNFVTGSIEGDQIIWDRSRIQHEYLKCWFWIDVLAAIPISTIFCFLESQKSQLGKDRLGEGSLRFARVLRILKFVRLIRVVKVVVLSSVFRQRYHHADLRSNSPGSKNWHTQKIKNETKLSRLFARTNHAFIRYTTQIKALTYTVVVLALLTHIQGCIYGSWHPEWSTSDVSVAMQRYCQSLWWAYTTLIDGSQTSGGKLLPLLETVMATERLVLGILAGTWIVFQGLLLCDEDAHLMLNKADALEYLQRRGVSSDTQIQLQNSFSETRRTRKLQRRFEALVEKEVSSELRHMIYIEMWGSKLISLGLIKEMSRWHEDFLCRLTETVHEEAHGAKAVVCKAGDWATIAYNVLEGLIHIISDLDREGQGIPDFSPGMWVGEKALVSTGFRRSNSIVASTTSTLMVVHSNAFQAIIDELKLRDRFQLFCTDELWKGLCGRCGAMGEHFTDECPHMYGRKEDQNSFFWQERSQAISRDLRMFIVEANLSEVLPALGIMGIHTLEDLESADFQELQRLVAQDLGKELSPTDIRSLSVSSIQLFKERTRGATQSIMKGLSERNVHFIFLSHYKLEAGTEASLMRFELEQKISMDQSGHFEGMDAPVFLDSEDLQSLKDLQERVRNSHNIALILTSGVLTRPWVLIEIVTAFEAGIHILPVQISKPGNDFQYPKEEFYQSLTNGEIVDESGIQLILESGYTLEKVATAVQNTFKRIAVTYSPHRPATIRHSEVDEFLRHCRYRSILARSMVSRPQQARSLNSQEAPRRSMDMLPVGRLDSEISPLRDVRTKSLRRQAQDSSKVNSQPNVINLLPADERPLLG